MKCMARLYRMVVVPESMSLISKTMDGCLIFYQADYKYAGYIPYNVVLVCGFTIFLQSERLKYFQLY